MKAACGVDYAEASHMVNVVTIDGVPDPASKGGWCISALLA
jgi:hypothetical protein